MGLPDKTFKLCQKILSHRQIDILLQEHEQLGTRQGKECFVIWGTYFCVGPDVMKSGCLYS